MQTGGALKLFRRIFRVRIFSEAYEMANKKPDYLNFSLLILNFRNRFRLNVHIPLKMRFIIIIFVCFLKRI